MVDKRGPEGRVQGHGVLRKKKNFELYAFARDAVFFT